MGLNVMKLHRLKTLKHFIYMCVCGGGGGALKNKKCVYIYKPISEHQI